MAPIGYDGPPPGADHAFARVVLQQQFATAPGGANKKCCQRCDESQRIPVFPALALPEDRRGNRAEREDQKREETGDPIGYAETLFPIEVFAAGDDNAIRARLELEITVRRQTPKQEQQRLCRIYVSNIKFRGSLRSYASLTQ